jgi:hypothetical protein
MQQRRELLKMMKILPETVQIGDNQRRFPLQDVLSGEDEVIQPGHDEMARE